MQLIIRSGFVFKTISIFVAAIFLFQQIAWAGDLVEMVLNKQAESQSQTFAPTYLQNQQAMQESVTAINQDIENFQNAITAPIQAQDASLPGSEGGLPLKGPRGGAVAVPATAVYTDKTSMSYAQDGQGAADLDAPILSVTTATGDVIRYKNSVIDSIEKEDGTVLRNIVVDENNNLTEAEVTYVDGTVQIISGAKVIRMTKPDGTIFNYEDEGRIASIVYLNGNTVYFSYLENGETTLTEPGRTSYYGIDDRLRLVEYNTGRKVRYESGVILEIAEPDLGVFIFELKINPNDTITSTLAQCRAANGNVYNYREGEGDHPVLITVERNGMLATYDKDGNLVSVASDGSVITVEMVTQAEADMAAAKARSVAAEGAFVLAEMAMEEAGRFELETARELADYKNVLSVKQSALDAKIRARLAIENAVSGIIAEIVDAQSRLAAARQVLDLALKEEAATQAEYEQAQEYLNSKNIYYEAVVADRISKENAVCIAQQVLLSKRALRDRAYSELQAATKSLNSSRAIMNAKRSEYDRAYKQYIAARKSGVDLAAKTKAKDQAYAALQAAIKDLDKAQAHRNATQAEYGNTHSDYLLANKSRSNARAALTKAKNLEALASKELELAQVMLKDKKAALDLKACNRKSAEYYARVIDSEIQSLNVRLTELQTVLAVTAGEESAMRAEYSLAQAAVLAGEGAHDIALQDLRMKEAALDIVKAEADTAKNELMSLSLILADLLSARALFSQKDTVLEDASSMVNIFSIDYDSARQLKEVRGMDGSRQSYSGGLVNSVSSSAGITLYSYDLAALGSIKSFTVDRDGIKSIYDEHGKITEIKNKENGLLFAFTGNAVSRIQKEDGTVIEGALFDDAGNIESAKIARPDGIIAIYSGGVLAEIREPSGSVFYYDANGNIIKYNKNGMAYNYSEEVEGGEAFTVASISNTDLIAIEDSDEIVFQKYDSSKKLVQLKKKSGMVINYSYTLDPAGKVSAITTSDGIVVTTYDKDYNMLKTEILPTADDPTSTISEYSYGKIRRVLKNGELIYAYNYEYDGSGKEIAVIKDVKTGDLKRYKDELLISVTDKNNLVTAYEYDADKKISKSTVTRSGKLINRYIYHYEADLTVMEDMDGVKRSYDKDNKILYLEEEGRTYQYSYSKDDSGKDVTTQKLISYKNELGDTINYVDGEVESIARADGTILKDFIFVNKDVNSYTIQEGDTRYYVEDGVVMKGDRADGTAIEYYTNGWAKSVTAPDGTVANYEYEVNDSQSQTPDNIIKEIKGVKYRYDKDGRLLYVEENNNRFYYDDTGHIARIMDLSNKTIYDYEYSGDGIVDKILMEKTFDITGDLAKFDISGLAISDKIELESYTDLPVTADPNYYRIPDMGTGSDGSKLVAADETLPVGTYNFTSLIINEGNTLTATPGTIINCLGTVTVNGTLSGANLNINAFAITIGTYGSVTGVGQHLSANTINNSGEMETPVGSGDPQSLNHLHYAGAFYDSATSIAAFDQAYTVSKIEYNMYGYGTNAHMSGGAWSSSSSTVYLEQDGTWVVIASSSANPSALNSSISSSWNNATKLKAVVLTQGGEERREVRNQCYITTLKAYIAPTCDYINSIGNVPVSKNTTGYINALKYYVNGWIDKDGIKADVLAQIPSSPLLLNDLYHGDLLYDPDGTFISDPVATNATNIDTIAANIYTPAGTSILFKTRTGSSANIEDGTWSDWIETIKDSDRYKINSPVNKYLQYQAVLRTSDISNTPSIFSNGDYLIKLSYSFNNSFDANAPPMDVPFKEYLTLSSPDLPAINIQDLNYDISEISQTDGYIKSCILSDDTIIETRSYKGDFLSVEGGGGNGCEEADITVNITSGNKITYFVNNKITVTYHRYDDGRLEPLVEYSYDGAGNLILVRLPNARDSIDSQLVEARQKIAAEAAAYLKKLAEENGLACQNIYANVESVRAQINTERARLRPLLYQEVTRQKWVGWWIFGWWETYRETVEVPQVRAALDGLDEQERILNGEAANAYAALDTQIKIAQDSLAKDESDSLNEISRQEKIFHATIIEEEATPVIIDAYRECLGRDPSDEETKVWLAKVDYNSKINAGELKSSLLASDERMAQEALVGALKSAIKDTLERYLAADSAGKKAILETLGLSEAEIVAFDEAEAAKIAAFLDEQNIHFGRSAFVALEALLKENGIAYNFEELALKVVLVDIFTGSISGVSEGKLLELSMFALSKVASLYGLELLNTKLAIEDISQVYGSTGTFIAHFKNNHFVVVTNVSDDGQVTYTELNKGKDGRTYTVSKEDFKDAWTGYAMVQAVSAKGAVPDWVHSKVISTAMAQHIKGSCFFFLFALIGIFIQGVVTIAAGIVAGIAAVVLAVSAAIAPIITAIGTFIAGVTNLLAGIATQIFTAIQFVGVSLLHGVGAFFGGTLFAGSAAAVGASTTGFSLTGLGFAIGKTVVLGALSFGISKGLDAIGVNPIISSLISSFLTGGVAGLFNSGFSAMSFLAGGLQGLAVQGTSVLGQQLGLDPNLSSIIGLAAGSLIGASLNGVWKPVFNADGVQIRSDFVTGLDAINYSIGATILPNVAGELAYYGMGKLGELLGVDPRISYLSGSLIRSYINPGVDQFGNPNDTWTSVMNGMLSGVANVSLQWMGEAFDLDPLISSATFSAIAGAIEGLFGVPQYDPVTGTYIKPNSIFEGVFNAYKNNVLCSLAVGMGNDPWKQSAYLAQILDFADIVKNRGLAAALDAYAAGIFNQAAIGSIVNLSGSVRNYFEQKIANHEYTDSADGGGFITRNYDVEDFGYIETAFDEFGNEYVTKVSIMGNTREGDFGIDANSRFGLKTGELATRFGSEYLVLQRIENGEQAYAEIRDWDTGEVLLVISPRAGGGYNVYDDRGEYINAVITDYLNNRRYAFDDAKLDYYSELDGTNSVPFVEMDWSDPDTFRLMFGNPFISADDISSINLTEQDKEQIIRYILLNGINNPNANGVSPGYMKGITQQLALADPNAEGSIFIPLYEQGGLVKDAWKWYNDVYLKSDAVTDDILGEYIAKFGATAGSDLVGIAYSGGGDPLIQALNKRSDIDMKSLVFVGAPLKYGRQITNPNVENVISIEGGWDAVVALAGGYFRSFEENPRPLNLYRIALGGVDHFHYTYDPTETNPDPLKVKSAAFISRITKYANNTAELNRFLTQTQGINYDDARKIYFVDLDKVRYDQ